MSKVARRIAAV